MTDLNQILHAINQQEDWLALVMTIHETLDEQTSTALLEDLFKELICEKYDVQLIKELLAFVEKHRTELLNGYPQWTDYALIHGTKEVVELAMENFDNNEIAAIMTFDTVAAAGKERLQEILPWIGNEYLYEMFEYYVSEVNYHTKKEADLQDDQKLVLLTVSSFLNIDLLTEDWDVTPGVVEKWLASLSDV